MSTKVCAQILLAAASLIAPAKAQYTPTSRQAPCSSPPTGGNVVPNGDFECGDIAPWTVQVPDTSAVYAITSPGQAGSNTAFEVDLVAPPATPESGVSARIISPALAVVPNTPYQLRFWANFSDVRCGFVGVMVNDSPIMTLDAADHGAASIGTWTENSVSYTPAADQITVKFEYLLGPALCHVEIDTITFTPL